jgi:uncharacterized SAM-binding protein YcdF (DUF218 family)
MFFILSKLLLFVIAPIVWVVGLLIYSFFTAVESRARKSRIAALTILLLTSNAFVVDEFYRAWEPVTPDIDLDKSHYQAAIILGGIGEVDLRLGKINFTGSADRLLQALPLYQQGRVDRLVFTGGSGSIEFPDKKEGVYVGKYLKNIGFPDEAVIIEKESRNTYENAIFTKKILDDLNLKGPFLLITSGFHMNRALAIFKKAGYEQVQPYVTNRHSGNRRFTPDHLLVPDPAAFGAFHTLLHEWVGYLVYKLRGYA